MDISDLDGISTAVQYYQPSIRYNPCCKSADKLTCRRLYVETLELTTTKHCGDRKHYNYGSVLLEHTLVHLVYGTSVINIILTTRLFSLIAYESHETHLKSFVPGSSSS